MQQTDPEGASKKPGRAAHVTRPGACGEGLVQHEGMRNAASSESQNSGRNLQQEWPRLLNLLLTPQAVPLLEELDPVFRRLDVKVVIDDLQDAKFF